MKTIYKYPITINDEQTIHMPRNAQMLTVQIQQNQVCIWALVETDESTQTRAISIRGTGHPNLDGNYSYIGTIQMHGGSLVWHVFENLN